MDYGCSIITNVNIAPIGYVGLFYQDLKNVGVNLLKLSYSCNKLKWFNDARYWSKLINLSSKWWGVVLPSRVKFTNLSLFNQLM